MKLVLKFLQGSISLDKVGCRIALNFRGIYSQSKKTRGKVSTKILRNSARWSFLLNFCLMKLTLGHERSQRLKQFKKELTKL